MYAWTLIFRFLSGIALETIGWYCCIVFIPVWQDYWQMRRRSMLGRLKDVSKLYRNYPNVCKNMENKIRFANGKILNDHFCSLIS